MRIAWSICCDIWHPKKFNTWNEHVNFTREPIIETIVSPKEGFKLLIKNSKGGNAEEFYVDALEVVSFGRTFFFRSLESPKAFLLPTSDYEVLEVKETRVALKNASYEKNIKIGGGREAPIRQREAALPPPTKEGTEPTEESTAAEPAIAESRLDKRRDRRRHRRRRMDEGEWAERNPAPPGEPSAPAGHEKSSGLDEISANGTEPKGTIPVFTPLIPPPPTLISQTLSRYKGKDFFEDPYAAEEKKEEMLPPAEKKEEEPGTDSTPLHRVHAPEESAPLTTAYFSAGQDTDGFNLFF